MKTARRETLYNLKKSKNVAPLNTLQACKASDGTPWNTLQACKASDGAT
jgi:hypothetical protein